MREMEKVEIVYFVLPPSFQVQDAMGAGNEQRAERYRGRVQHEALRHIDESAKREVSGINHL